MNLKSTIKIISLLFSVVSLYFVYKQLYLNERLTKQDILVLLIISLFFAFTALLQNRRWNESKKME
ncbi:hypothetical protein SAMN04487995_2487 [Dyadobacter koreensis]|uniref:Uncharacterized protein n=1 Tax=Dyadobacter koreensis TaxID=408657 RepID=A0A1H6U3Q1_9BACT|nr:hypothetical protein SAMN04487995_2487 [Dyadobacter koreensis]